MRCCLAFFLKPNRFAYAEKLAAGATMAAPRNSKSRVPTSEGRGVNGFYLSCNLQRFSVQSVFFDVPQTEAAMRRRALWCTATRSPRKVDVFQAGGQPSRLFAPGE